MTFFFFFAGLILLIVGAEALVKGASSLAAAFGISPLVIGLTVVAFGTSSPELAVSIKAALSGQASIAVGNIVGSNIFNILFILGISGLIVPLVVSQQLVRFDVPLMIALSVIVFVFSLDGIFSRANGITLFTGLIIYICFLIFQSRRESIQVKEQYKKNSGRKVGLTAAGLKISSLFLVASLCWCSAHAGWSMGRYPLPSIWVLANS
ncbi:MAG: hypothetical protein R2864_09325 [Syntrophotaleaceae bacterium]